MLEKISGEQLNLLKIMLLCLCLSYYVTQNNFEKFSYLQLAAAIPSVTLFLLCNYERMFRFLVRNTNSNYSVPTTSASVHVFPRYRIHLFWASFASLLFRLRFFRVCLLNASAHSYQLKENIFPTYWFNTYHSNELRKTKKDHFLN